MKKTYAEKLEGWRLRREKMAELREEGLTLDAIGKRFRCTRQRVIQILNPKKDA